MNLDINQAIDEVKAYCDTLMKGYHPVSLRSALYALGYDKEESDAVIRDCAERGFTNCIDPIIATKSYPDFEERFPTSDVCYWGPDQLKSRLWSLHN
jgi:hypothetical protein